MSDTMPVEIILDGGGGGYGGMPASAAEFEYYCGDCGDQLEETETEGLFHGENRESCGFMGLGSKRSAEQCRHVGKTCEKPRFIFNCKVVAQ